MKLEGLMHVLEDYCCDSKIIKCREEDFITVRAVIQKLTTLLANIDQRNRFFASDSHVQTVVYVLQSLPDRCARVCIIRLLFRIIYKSGCKKHATFLVQKGLTRALFHALFLESAEPSPNEEFIIRVHQLLYRIGRFDKRFGVRARISQCLPITLSLLRSQVALLSTYALSSSTSISTASASANTLGNSVSTLATHIPSITLNVTGSSNSTTSSVHGSGSSGCTNVSPSHLLSGSSINTHGALAGMVVSIPSSVNRNLCTVLRTIRLYITNGLGKTNSSILGRNGAILLLIRLLAVVSGLPTPKSTYPGRLSPTLSLNKSTSGSSVPTCSNLTSLSTSASHPPTSTNISSVSIPNNASGPSTNLYSNSTCMQLPNFNRTSNDNGLVIGSPIVTAVTATASAAAALQRHRLQTTLRRSSRTSGTQVNSVSILASSASSLLSTMPALIAVGVCYYSKLLRLILNTLHCMIKWKHNAVRTVDAGGISLLLDLFLDVHRCDLHGRRLALQRSLLACLKCLTTSRAGRKLFIVCGGLHSLFALCSGYVGPDPLGRTALPVMYSRVASEGASASTSRNTKSRHDHSPRYSADKIPQITLKRNECSSTPISSMSSSTTKLRPNAPNSVPVVGTLESASISTDEAQFSTACPPSPIASTSSTSAPVLPILKPKLPAACGPSDAKSTGDLSAAAGDSGVMAEDHTALNPVNKSEELATVLNEACMLLHRCCPRSRLPVMSTGGILRCPLPQDPATRVTSDSAFKRDATLPVDVERPSSPDFHPFLELAQSRDGAVATPTGTKRDDKGPRSKDSVISDKSTRLVTFASLENNPLSAPNGLCDLSDRPVRSNQGSRDARRRLVVHKHLSDIGRTVAGGVDASRTSKGKSHRTRRVRRSKLNNRSCTHMSLSKGTSGLLSDALKNCSNTSVPRVFGRHHPITKLKKRPMTNDHSLSRTASESVVNASEVAKRIDAGSQIMVKTPVSASLDRGRPSPSVLVDVDDDDGDDDDDDDDDDGEDESDDSDDRLDDGVVDATTAQSSDPRAILTDLVKTHGRFFPEWLDVPQLLPPSLTRDVLASAMETANTQWPYHISSLVIPNLSNENNLDSEHCTSVRSASHYLDHVRHTQTLVPPQTVAYPDLVGARGAPFLELLHDRRVVSSWNLGYFATAVGCEQMVQHGPSLIDHTESGAAQWNSTVHSESNKSLRVPSCAQRSYPNSDSEHQTLSSSRCNTITQPSGTAVPKRVSRSMGNSHKLTCDRAPPRLPYSLCGLQHVELLDDVRRLIDPEDLLNRTVFDLDDLFISAVREAQQAEAHSGSRPNSPFVSYTSAIVSVESAPPASSPAVSASYCGQSIHQCPDRPEYLSACATRANTASSHGMATPDIPRTTNLTYPSGPVLNEGAVAPSVILSASEVYCAGYGDNVLSNEDEVCVDHFDLEKDYLEFESRFESGNLRKAIQIRQYEYDLILSPDVNTVSNLQWFYFRVSNVEADVDYRFNIINCEKPGSQYTSGMQPLLFSVREALQGRGYWRRTGKRINYYRNYFTRVARGKRSNDGNTYFTATFSIRFPHTGDVCYLAYHYPYTYTRLLADLSIWQDKVQSMQDQKGLYFRVQVLTTSVLDNKVPVITVTQMPGLSDKETSFGAADAVNVDPASASKSCVVNRPYIFLTARVHSGESNSSWVMQGLIDRLLSSDPKIVRLREMFVFKIVPMLNPDGVICGNHRCSMAGKDLNRRWISPSPDIHPTIYHSKKLLQLLHACERQPYIFIDFHGHSRMKNIFLYGCSPLESWKSLDTCNPTYRAGPGPMEDRSYRHLAELLDTLSPSFAKKSCMYAVNKSKETTARVAIWREFGVMRSYTIEASYCGVTGNDNVSDPQTTELSDADAFENGYQLRPTDLRAFGEQLLTAFLTLPEYDQQHPIPVVSTMDSATLSSPQSTLLQFETSAFALLGTECVVDASETAEAVDHSLRDDSSLDSISTLSFVSPSSGSSSSASGSCASPDNLMDG